MPSSTMMNQLDNAEGKFEINKEELQAVVRNINRKEGKLKRSKQYKWALVTAIGAMAVAMACMFAVTFAAVETTKESHVEGHTSQLTSAKSSTSIVQTADVAIALPMIAIPLLPVTMKVEGE